MTCISALKIKDQRSSTPANGYINVCNDTKIRPVVMSNFLISQRSSRSKHFYLLSEVFFRFCTERQTDI